MAEPRTSDSRYFYEEIGQNVVIYYFNYRNNYKKRRLNNDIDGK